MATPNNQSNKQNQAPAKSAATAPAKQAQAPAKSAAQAAPATNKAPQAQAQQAAADKPKKERKARDKRTPVQILLGVPGTAVNMVQRLGNLLGRVANSAEARARATTAIAALQDLGESVRLIKESDVSENAAPLSEGDLVTLPKRGQERICATPGTAEERAHAAKVAVSPFRIVRVGTEHARLVSTLDASFTENAAPLKGLRRTFAAPTATTGTAASTGTQDDDKDDAEPAV